MNNGFIQFIIILVLLLVIVSLMGVRLLDVVNNKIVKDNFSFAWNFSNWMWDNYLHNPVKIAWQLWVDILWKPFVGAMEKIKSGQSAIPGTQ